MLENARVTVFTISESLREKPTGGKTTHNQMPHAKLFYNNRINELLPGLPQTKALYSTPT